MAKLFLDEKKEKINPDLFITEADKYVKDFCVDIETNYKGRAPIKNTQLRRFYNEVLILKAKTESTDDFSHVLPYIKMIVPKSFYAKTREHVGQSFVSFIGEYIRPLTTESQKDFLVFCDLFEAIIAFYPKDKDGGSK